MYQLSDSTRNFHTFFGKQFYSVSIGKRNRNRTCVSKFRNGDILVQKIDLFRSHSDERGLMNRGLIYSPPGVAHWRHSGEEKIVLTFWLRFYYAHGKLVFALSHTRGERSVSSNTAALCSAWGIYDERGLGLRNRSSSVLLALYFID
jgi:hypothetical protein